MKDIEILYHAEGDPVRHIDVDGDRIAEIIMNYGAPPALATEISNAILEYLIRLHLDAGATGLQ
jgi:hypothetical protein